MNRIILIKNIKDTAARLSLLGLMRTRFFIFGATLALTLLPFWLLSTNSFIHDRFSNEAEAAVDARVPMVDEVTKAKVERAASSGLIQDRDLLLGMTHDNVHDALSYPHMKRVEGPIEIWQYRTASCVLDVYFNQSQVAHYEIRAREKAVMVSQGAALHKVNQSGCIKNLLSGA